MQIAHYENSNFCTVEKVFLANTLSAFATSTEVNVTKISLILNILGMKFFMRNFFLTCLNIFSEIFSMEFWNLILPSAEIAA